MLKFLKTVNAFEKKPPLEYNQIIEREIRKAALRGRDEVRIESVNIGSENEGSPLAKKLVSVWAKNGFDVRWDTFYEGRECYSKILVVSWKR
jgi:hypothetical protein